MKKKKYIKCALLIFVLLSLTLFIGCRFYLFTDDTAKFHSYLNQANGMRITIFENGDLKVNTGVLSSEEQLYKDIHKLFATAKLRPSPRQMIEKLFTGNILMLGDANAQFSIFISLFQDEEPRHSIFLGGNNMMYFDKKEFFLGDFSNASELQIMNGIYLLLQQ